MTTTKRPRIQAVTEDARVTPIELFFDLVFVFSLTQVTALMSHDLTGQGVVRGMLVLCLLWWCWVGFAWIGNVLRADEGVGRVAMFGSMGAMFVLALCVPEAFVDLRGGLFGPVVLAITYLLLRLFHLGIFWLAGAARSRAPPPARPVLPVPAREHRAAVGGVATGRHGADAGVGGRAGRRLPRHDPGRRVGVAAQLGRPLRRAARAHRDHRARRVDRRDRFGRGVAPDLVADHRRRRRSGSRWPRVCGGRTSTCWRSPRNASCATPRARSARGSHATRTATCTCR